MTTANEPSDAEIERVAASMYEALSRDLKDKWPKATNGQKAVYRKQARAAILAMDRRDEVVGEPVAYAEVINGRVLTVATQKGRHCTAPLYASPPVPVVAVPEGWKLVPVEPTFEMCDADAGTSTTERRMWNAAHYRAMLAAAPEPPATRSEEPDGWIALGRGGKQWLIYTQQEADHNTRHGICVRPYWCSPATRADADLDYRRAFIAQSRKLQHVLAIPGVKDALADLEWGTLDTGEAMLTDLRNEGIEMAAQWHDKRVADAERACESFTGEYRMAWEDTRINHTEHATAIRALKDPRHG
jgi:hypothetical protein